MTTRRQVLRLLAVGGTASLVAACSKPLLARFPTPAVAAAPPAALAERSIDIGEAAAVTADGYREVAVESVRVNVTTQQHVMLLQELGTQRLLPITTSRFGADAIAIPMQQIPVSRPLSHTLMLDLVTATGSRVREVRIDRVAQSEEGDTFYSTIVLATPAGSRPVDARPSDAVPLALHAQVPIRVARDVLEAAGIAYEAEPAEAAPQDEGNDEHDEVQHRETGVEAPSLGPGPSASAAMDFVEVEVESIRINKTSQQRVVMLKQKDSGWYLPIWPGDFGADAIARARRKVPSSRPLTHPLMLALIEAAGCRVNAVLIDRVVDETFYSSIFLDTAAGTTVVDARPSDAIPLAIYTGVPINVATTVMESAAILLEADDPATQPDEPEPLEAADGAAIRPIRVLIVHAESAERKRLRADLPAYRRWTRGVSGRSDIAVVGGAASGADALRLVGERRPDVVLASAQLPDMSGPALCQRLGAEAPGVAVAMLGTCAEAEEVRACVRAGAQGYLLPGGSSSLDRGVRGLAHGDAVLSPRAAFVLLDPGVWERPGADGHLTLSEDERLMLRLMASGQSDEEIEQGWHLPPLTDQERERLREMLQKELPQDWPDRQRAIDSQVEEWSSRPAPWASPTMSPLILDTAFLDSFRGADWLATG